MSPNDNFVDTPPQFTASFPALFTFQIIAWDGKKKPESGSEQISHKARIWVK
jgi:hypothetical protein